MATQEHSISKPIRLSADLAYFFGTYSKLTQLTQAFKGFSRANVFAKNKPYNSPAKVGTEAERASWNYGITIPKPVFTSQTVPPTCGEWGFQTRDSGSYRQNDFDNYIDDALPPVQILNQALDFSTTPVKAIILIDYGAGANSAYNIFVKDAFQNPARYGVTTGYEEGNNLYFWCVIYCNRGVFAKRSSQSIKEMYHSATPAYVEVEFTTSDFPTLGTPSGNYTVVWFVGAGYGIDHTERPDSYFGGSESVAFSLNAKGGCDRATFNSTVVKWNSGLSISFNGNLVASGSGNGRYITSAPVRMKRTNYDFAGSVYYELELMIVSPQEDYIGQWSTQKSLVVATGSQIVRQGQDLTFNIQPSQEARFRWNFASSGTTHYLVATLKVKETSSSSDSDAMTAVSNALYVQY